MAVRIGRRAGSGSERQRARERSGGHHACGYPASQRRRAWGIGRTDGELEPPFPRMLRPVDRGSRMPRGRSPLPSPHPLPRRRSPEDHAQTGGRRCLIPSSKLCGCTTRCATGRYDPYGVDPARGSWQRRLIAAAVGAWPAAVLSPRPLALHPRASASPTCAHLATPRLSPRAGRLLLPRLPAGSTAAG
jgi:hypothetical protein